MALHNIYDGRRALRILLIVTVSVLAVVVSGCNEAAKDETPLIPEQSVVTPAPYQLYLKVGQLEQFTYWGHNFAVNYTSAYPAQIVKISLDGVERIIQKEPTENPIGIYWKEGNLSFTLKPVVWEIRDGQKIPIYESTWNTTEVFFEVFIGGRI